MSGCLPDDHVQSLTLTACCSLLVFMLYACAQALLVPPRPAGGALQGHQALTGHHPQDRPLSTTRIAARRNLLFSLLRLNRALNEYARNDDTEVTWAMDAVEWQQMAELEGVLFIGSATTTTTVQTENCFMAALEAVMKFDIF